MWPFTNIFGVFSKWGTLLLALLGAVWGIYARGRKAGVQSQVDKLRRETSETKEKFDAIDHRNDSFDDAIGRLQARSRDRD